MQRRTTLEDERTRAGEDAGGAASGDRSGDRLAALFARQEELSRFYREVRSGGFYDWEPIARCTTWTRAIVHECCELDDELSWKPWKNPRDLVQTREARLAEMADILHFYLQLALDQGFTADEIYAAYIQKNAENRERQRSDARYRPGAHGGARQP